MQSKASATSGDGYVYALEFYGLEISLGRSVDLIDPDTNEGVTVTEVTVDGDTRARGYIVNEVENNEFLYFADVNRNTNVLTTYENITGELETFSNLLESTDYLDTDKFDFIEYSPEYMTTYGSGCGFWKKIWGECTTYGNITDIGNGMCGQSSITITYRLGFMVEMEPHYNTFPCN
nr:hypothetical protein [uncultured Flavobacterium sp.]